MTLLSSFNIRGRGDRRLPLEPYMVTYFDLSFDLNLGQSLKSVSCFFFLTRHWAAC